MTRALTSFARALGKVLCVCATCRRSVYGEQARVTYDNLLVCGDCGMQADRV
jgi:hypothetical protein